MLKPSGINKYAKKDPENLLHEHLYKKFGQISLTTEKDTLIILTI